MKAFSRLIGEKHDITMRPTLFKQIACHLCITLFACTSVLISVSTSMHAVNLKKTLFLAVDKSLHASDTILVPIR